MTNAALHINTAMHVSPLVTLLVSSDSARPADERLTGVWTAPGVFPADAPERRVSYVPRDTPTVGSLSALVWLAKADLSGALGFQLP